MTIRPSRRAMLPFLVLAVAAAGSAPARAGSLSISYDISLGGLTIGAADVAMRLDGQRYNLQAQARLTGLAGAVTGFRGAANASGSVATATPLPSSFAVTSANSRDRRTVRVGLASGNVVAVDISPPLDDRADRVPVKDAHKRGVVDPLSALLMPVFGRGDPTGPAACNRTIPVFDGAARFNVVLAYAGTRMIEKPGYAGPAVVCEARYVPIAGHRPERPATKFMVDNREMSVWLAPVEGTRILVPLRISVKTMVGTTVIEAARLSFERDVRAAPAPSGTRGAAGCEGCDGPDRS
jgi:hypothetical protein